jgi:hypothetical protein
MPDENGSILHLLPPEYHGDPVDARGALVVREWGDDILTFIGEHSGMPTTVHRVRNRWYGIDGQLLDVFVSQKPSVTSTILKGTEQAGG